MSRAASGGARPETAAGADRYPWRPARVRVGTVGKAHGLDGRFYVDAACGWFGFAPRSRILVGGEPATIAHRGGLDARPLVGLEARTTREAAEALRGQPLELERAQLPEPEPDSWFRFDLVGCEVVSGGRALGRVAAVEDGVAHDVLVLDDAEPTRIPFVAALVPQVDIAARRVEVVEGLFG